MITFANLIFGYPTGDVDYEYPENGYIRVVVPAGKERPSFSIKTINDNIVERTETFRVSIVDISLPHGVTVGDIPSAEVNILSEDSKYLLILHDMYVNYLVLVTTRI